MGPIVESGHVEPAPRRVRGYAGGELVFDTIAARYVWEVPYYPQYYVPLDDVTPGALVDENRSGQDQSGTFRGFGVELAGGRTEAKVYDTGHVAGLVRFEPGGLDWFEEDEPIVGHPRNPYARVDALRSHRHVTVELDGVILADTGCPIMLFETGLPTRYYIDRTDVAFEHLVPSDTTTLCPYKGTTSQYWSVRVDGTEHRDLAWTYDRPLPAVSAIAGLVAFYDEKVDIAIDGVGQARPVTQFT